LIVAYQFLLDWFLQQYKKNIKKYAKRLHKISATDYKLTIQERKRILTEHIFGVDIDAQAIEVSKLSLLLKVLEGQSDRELQKTLFNTERALPDLDANIRCGNTLVGTDYFSLLKSDEEEWLRVNPFDWQLEFKPVFDDGGFDVIIGNPPYGATLSPQEKTYMKNRYKDVHIRTPDKSNYYISQTLRLLKSGGYFSFILPNNLLFQNEYEKTRLLLLQQKIDRILNLGDGVFLQATVPTCILVAEKQSVNSYRFMFADLRGTKQSKTIKTVPGKQMIQAAQIFKTPSYVFGMTAKYFTVLKKILSKSLLIDEIAEEVASGIASGADKIFRVSETFAGKNKLERTLLKKVLIGREIDRYHIENTNHFII
jgi:type I restriction-modification system DNA methylase subunit